MTGRAVAIPSTRARLLAAAEALLLEAGFDAMSLREVTLRAGSNLAAVHYHFGDKQALMRALLDERCERLNRERLTLLEAAQGTPDTATLLGFLFAPALRIEREESGDFLRLLGRVYVDPSPFLIAYTRAHYEAVMDGYFEAFARAQPARSRKELAARLCLTLRTLSTLLADPERGEFTAACFADRNGGDARQLAQAIALVEPLLSAAAAAPSSQRIERALAPARTSARESSSGYAKPSRIIDFERFPSG